jgi:hypothetical protein
MAQSARRRWGLRIGWLLAVPGLVVIACFLALTPLAGWAGCTMSGWDIVCPPGLSGEAARGVHFVVVMTAIFSFVGFGLLPPLYAVAFCGARFVIWIAAREPVRSMQPTRRFLALAGVVLALIALLGVVLRILGEQ